MRAWMSAYTAFLCVPPVCPLPQSLSNSKKLNELLGPEFSCFLLPNAATFAQTKALRGFQEIMSRQCEHVRCVSELPHGICHSVMHSRLFVGSSDSVKCKPVFRDAQLSFEQITLTFPFSERLLATSLLNLKSDGPLWSYHLFKIVSVGCILRTTNGHTQNAHTHRAAPPAIYRQPELYLFLSIVLFAGYRAHIYISFCHLPLIYSA